MSVLNYRWGFFWPSIQSANVLSGSGCLGVVYFTTTWTARLPHPRKPLLPSAPLSPPPSPVICLAEPVISGIAGSSVWPWGSFCICYLKTQAADTGMQDLASAQRCVSERRSVLEGH